MHYRLRKLEESGVIKSYTTKIHQPLFCSGVATLLCKLTNLSEERIGEIKEFILQHKYINWCSDLCGTYDIVIVFLYTDSQNMADTVSDITNFIGKNLIEHNLSIYITEYKFGRSSLLTEKNKKYEPSTVSFNQPHAEMDKTDLGILRLIASNARMKNKDISKKMSISEDKVRIRIKKLEKKKVIKKNQNTTKK